MDLQVAQISEKFRKTFTAESGTKYTLKMLPAMRGAILGKQLLNVMLPAAGKTLDGMQQDDDLLEPRTFSDLATMLCERSDKLDLQAILTELFNDCLIEIPGETQRKLHFDTDFMCNYSEMIATIQFALNANFGDAMQGKGIGLHLMALVTKIMGQG